MAEGEEDDEVSDDALSETESEESRGSDAGATGDGVAPGVAPAGGETPSRQSSKVPDAASAEALHTNSGSMLFQRQNSTAGPNKQGWAASGATGGASAATQMQLRAADKRIAKLEKHVKYLRTQELRVRAEVKSEVSRALMETMTQQRAHEELDSRVGKLGDDVSHIQAEAALLDSKVRSEKHRVHHVATSATKAEEKIDNLAGTLVETKGDISGLFQRFAQSLRSLSGEIEGLRSENADLRREISAAHERAGQASDDIIAKFGQEMIARLREALESQRTMLAAHQGLEKQVKACVRRDELSALDSEFKKYVDQQAQLEKYVTEQMFAAHKGRGFEELVQSWSVKREAKERLKVYRDVLNCWNVYVRRRENIREALGRTHHQYAKAHCREWVRTWWYVMQKETNSREFQRLTEENMQQNTQLEMLLATMHRHEKKSAEQVKQTHSRLINIENSVDQVDSKKAEKTEVAESFASLEAKLDRDFNITAIRESIEDVSNQVVVLERTKYNTDQGLHDQRVVSDLAEELRSILIRHEDSLSKCALVDNMVTKADAKLVEQVFVLLAQQADQLANLLAVDLAHIKRALAKFLELSPDVRKAALSVGLDPNEQCMSCRAMNKKFLAEVAISADGASYSLDKELSGQGMPEQARKILNDKLGFPTALESSMAAGSSVLQANQAAFLPDTARATMNETQQKLRGLLGAHPGWLTGAELDAQKRANARTAVMQQRANGQQETVPKGFFPASAAASEAAERPFSAVSRSSGSGGGRGSADMPRSVASGSPTPPASVPSRPRSGSSVGGGSVHSARGVGATVSFADGAGGPASGAGSRASSLGSGPGRPPIRQRPELPAVRGVH